MFDPGLLRFTFTPKLKNKLNTMLQKMIYNYEFAWFFNRNNSQFFISSSFPSLFHKFGGMLNSNKNIYKTLKLQSVTKFSKLTLACMPINLLFKAKEYLLNWRLLTKYYWKIL